MCGLVGMIAKRKQGFFDVHRELFQNMLIADSIRGADSTGAFCVNKNATINLLKFESHPMHLMATQAWDRFERKIVSDGIAVIGHNRKATQGDVKNENSHPFHAEDITLVHNGTLFNHKEVDATTEVDSHAICKAINQHGYVEALKKLKGAYALIWYQESTKNMFMINNGDRPLSIVETDDHVFLASEMGMLYWLLGRTGTKIDPKNTRHLTKYELVKIHVEPGKLSTTVTDMTKDLEPKVFQGPVNQWPRIGSGTTNQAEPAAHDKPPMASQVKMLEIIKDYPAGKEVVFFPAMAKPKEVSQGAYLIEGIAYQPGLEAVGARYWCPASFTFDDAADFGSEGRLIGKVKYHSSDKDGEWLILKDVRSDVIDRTWNNTELSEREFGMICEVADCVKCHKPLDPDQMALTKVSELPNELYDCTCHRCVIDQKDDMTIEFKQRLEAALGNEALTTPTQH